MASDTGSGRHPVSLKGMQVDLTTRLGAQAPTTPTGLAALDQALHGGFRSGTTLCISGEPGSGKSTLALYLAYMSARAGAAVLFVSASMDETEVMARLAARALHREWPGSNTSYGSIWSGVAWQDDQRRGPLGQAVEAVVDKVGARLHLYKAAPFEDTLSILEVVSRLWERHERVVLVIDDANVLSAGAGGDAKTGALVNAEYDNRVSQVAYELAAIAHQGCAVVATVPREGECLVLGAATIGLRLDAEGGDGAKDLSAERVRLGMCKNRLGPRVSTLLRVVRGAAIVEELGEGAG